LVEQRCRSQGFLFKGWFGDFKCRDTKLNLYNPRTDNLWNTTSAGKFLEGKGDPLEALERRKVNSREDEEVAVRAFRATGKYLDGTVFKRNLNKMTNRGYYSYWDYWCPVCSYDEYVQNHLCTGVFTVTGSNLKNGVLACRCQATPRWSEDQRWYQIHKICVDEGYSLQSWLSREGYVNKRSKFKWICSEKHECITSVEDFVTCGSRCKTCHGSSFNTSLPSYLYLSQWYNDSFSFLKYGITNKTPRHRNRKQESVSLLSHKPLYSVYYTDGVEIEKTENYFKSLYGRKGVCPKYLLPDGYTETVLDTVDNRANIITALKNLENSFVNN